MKLFQCKILIVIFKLLCCLITIFMVGYWMSKFCDNKDQTSVSYHSYDSMDEIIYPEITVCVQPPFLRKPFEELGIDIIDYEDYLSGSGEMNLTFPDIDFNNVTINLQDYVANISINTKHGSTENCSDKEKCPFIKIRNSFNGFWVGTRLLYKCFSIE